MANQPPEVFIICAHCKTCISSLEARQVFLPLPFEDIEPTKMPGWVCELCHDSIMDAETEKPKPKLNGIDNHW